MAGQFEGQPAYSAFWRGPGFNPTKNIDKIDACLKDYKDQINVGCQNSKCSLLSQNEKKMRRRKGQKYHKN